MGSIGTLSRQNSESVAQVGAAKPQWRERKDYRPEDDADGELQLILPANELHTFRVKVTTETDRYSISKSLKLCWCACRVEIWGG